MISLSEVKASLLGGFFLSLSIVLVTFLPPNTNIEKDIYDLEIVEGMTSKEVFEVLDEDEVIRNHLSFRFAAWILGYHQGNISKGLFQIQKGWNNWTLIHNLRSTPRKAIQVKIKPFRMRRNTLMAVCKNLDIKYTALKAWLEDEEYLAGWGDYNQENVYCLFIPDTLLLYQDSRAKEIADRLFRNYLKFWSPERLEQAASLGLTPEEVSILASIVYAETKIPQEMPVIAGLYLNRLRKPMRLQADPTVVYAAGRPLNRVLRAHKRIRSDYNTYKVNGLPPGPVFTPTVEAIEAVLFPRSHEYFYFCARNDLSGYHHFSRTLSEHQQRAQQYQRELNKRRIGFKGS